MSILKTGGLIRKTIKKLAPIVGLLALGASQSAVAVNLINPDNYDWNWDSGGEPTFPNECYGSGNDCKVDTDNNSAGKSNEGDNKLFDVWVPSGAGPFPVYIHAHGGGFTGGSKKRMVLSGPLLQADDVVYVNVNYTLNGQTSSGGQKSIDDVVDCLQYLKANASKYKINKNQIFVGGGSAGGIITNDIAYKQTVSGIRGIWHWNLWQSSGQSVDLTDQQLLGSVDLPVVNAHPDPYPSDSSHSAKDAYEHSRANWQAGSSGIFLQAKQEHKSAIGYGPYSYIEQIWKDGKWIKDSRDNTDTGEKIPNLAEWIYDIVGSGGGNPPPPPAGDDFYDDYSSDDLFNSSYIINRGTWKVRNVGNLDNLDMTTHAKVVVDWPVGNNFEVSVDVKTVDRNDAGVTWQVPRLMFSYKGGGNYYEVFVKSDGKLVLDKTKQAERNNIETVQLENYDDSVPNTIRVRKNGSSIKVFVNNQKYMEVNDGALSSGDVGLRSSKARGRFDNLSIVDKN